MGSATHCPTHGGSAIGRRQQLARDHGLFSVHWRTLRALVLIRDSYTCQMRYPGCTDIATTVHLDPALDGDHSKAQPIDCISACHHCHGTHDAKRSAGNQQRHA